METKKKLKIGLISYRSNPFSGGQGIYIRHLSSALYDLGHDIEVISGPPYPDLRQGINLVKIPSLDLFSYEDIVSGTKKYILSVFLKLAEALNVNVELIEPLIPPKSSNFVLVFNISLLLDI